MMCSDPLQNFPHSVDVRGSSVLSTDVTRATNNTLKKFYFEKHYEDYLGFYKQYKSLFGAKKRSAEMQSEKIILCETNAGLWSKAIKSAISSLTIQSYPHYIIVQEFINYLLNADSDENLGLLDSFFWQLVLFHPPTPEMFDYYTQVMLNHFVVLCNNGKEEQNLFVCLMEASLNTLQNMIDANGNNEWSMFCMSNNVWSMFFLNKSNSDFLKESYDSSASCSEQEKKVVKKNLDNVESNQPKGNVKPLKVNFRDLQWNARIKRCLIALNFAYNILETDFAFWMNSKKWKPFLIPKKTKVERRLLLSHILWPDARDIGLINKDVHRVLDLYQLLIKSNLDYQFKNIIEKFTILIGEVIRCNDSTEGVKYPFVGTKLENFFRELSIILHEVITEMYRTKQLPKYGLLVNFKPPWLRLFLCSHLLSSITGSQCLPELTTGYDILMQILHNESRSKDVIKAAVNSRNIKDSKAMQKFKKLKSINAKLPTGKTYLHIACEENDIEKIKALLTLPELDVNVTDREGWTALHRAACAGNLESVKELLSFSPKSKNLRRAVNARARGPQSFTPIMCAALENHADICKALLEHSGSILLEDTNEFNETALELAKSSTAKNILEYYKKNNVSTFHSHKDYLNSEIKQLLLRLCTEMIQAYFGTHRTWDVYKTLKRYKNCSPEELSDSSEASVECKWDYMRYHRDIKRNICKLRALISDLKKMEEFKEFYEVYVQLLSFNKEY